MKNIISFFIEGENIVVVNPCTIPIDMMKEALKGKREKNIVTTCLGFEFEKKGKTNIKSKEEIKWIEKKKKEC